MLLLRYYCIDDLNSQIGVIVPDDEVDYLNGDLTYVSHDDKQIPDHVLVAFVCQNYVFLDQLQVLRLLIKDHLEDHYLNHQINHPVTNGKTNYSIILAAIIADFKFRKKIEALYYLNILFLLFYKIYFFYK